MDGHGDINANPWDEWDTWLNFPTQDEPHGASETNVVGSGLSDQPRNACKFIPETESKCIPTNIAGRLPDSVERTC